jgi:hypothetical protein
MATQRRELWAERAEVARVAAAIEADNGLDLEPEQIDAIAAAALADIRHRGLVQVNPWDGYQVSFE